MKVCDTDGERINETEAIHKLTCNSGNTVNRYAADGAVKRKIRQYYQQKETVVQTAVANKRFRFPFISFFWDFN